MRLWIRDFPGREFARDLHAYRNDELLQRIVARLRLLVRLIAFLPTFIVPRGVAFVVYAGTVDMLRRLVVHGLLVATVCRQYAVVESEAEHPLNSSWFTRQSERIPQYLDR